MLTTTDPPPATPGAAVTGDAVTGDAVIETTALTKTYPGGVTALNALTVGWRPASPA